MPWSVLLGALVAIALASIPVAAQDRMPPIPADKLTDAQKEAIEGFKSARGVEISGPFIPLLRSPEVLTRARAMGDYLRFRSALPPRLREFVILMTARTWTQQYEWHAHEPLAVSGGLSRDIIAAVAEGRRPQRMAEDERAIYDLVDELQRNHAVSDTTYAGAVGAVGEQGLIDAVALVGQYSMLAMVLNTARTPLPPGAAPPLTPFP